MNSGTVARRSATTPTTAVGANGHKNGCCGSVPSFPDRPIAVDRFSGEIILPITPPEVFVAPARIGSTRTTLRSSNRPVSTVAL